MWLSDAPKVPVFEGVDRHIFETEIVPAHRPAILKGLVRDWPTVTLAAQSPEALCEYLGRFANDRKVVFQTAAPEIKGRYSFNDELSGLNHLERQLAFAEIAKLLLRDAAIEGAPTHYAGGVPVEHIMPGVALENRLDLLPADKARMVMLWIGNKTRSAAHWDLPQNLACVIAGKRRFTLFPIEQVENLYITPLDMTLAGQPTSLVDFYNPDFERFPRFREAMAHATVADLEPGDALYMPSLTIHHVEALDPFGAMINVWWRDGPDYLHKTTPLLTLLHGLLTLRDLPLDERLSWRSLFDHYLFQPERNALDHIPEKARGLFGEMSAKTEHQLKAHLIKTLGL